MLAYVHGDDESHPWLSSKASLRLFKLVPDTLVTHLPPTCNSNWFGYIASYISLLVIKITGDFCADFFLLPMLIANFTAQCPMASKTPVPSHIKLAMMISITVK